MKTLWLVPLLASSAQAATVVPIHLEGETAERQTEVVTYHFDKPYFFELTTDLDECAPCRVDVSFARVTLYAGFDDFGYDDSGGIPYDNSYPGGWRPTVTRNIAPAGEQTLIVEALTWPGRYGDGGGVNVLTTLRVWPTPEPASGVVLGALLPALLKRRR